MRLMRGDETGDGPDSAVYIIDTAAQVRAEIEEFDPQAVYGPSPQEMHPDHRAASRAVMAA